MAGAIPRPARRRNPALPLHFRQRRNRPPRLPRRLRAGFHGTRRTADSRPNQKRRAHRPRAGKHQQRPQRPVSKNLRRCQRSPHRYRRRRKLRFHGFRFGQAGRTDFSRHCRFERFIHRCRRDDRAGRYLLRRQKPQTDYRRQPHSAACAGIVRQARPQRRTVPVERTARHPARVRRRRFVHRQPASARRQRHGRKRAEKAPQYARVPA